MRSLLVAALLLAAATAAYAVKATPYVGIITWNDGTTATIRPRQRPSTDFHSPPYTWGKFRCKGTCPKRRGYASLMNAFPMYGAYIRFNGPNGEAAGPRCFLTYADDFVDPVTGCERDERTLHCTEAGREAPPDGTLVVTTTKCRALLPPPF